MLASIFRKIKSNMVKPQSPEPPYEKNGSGTPMVGNIPATMAILTKKCINRTEATQYRPVYSCKGFFNYGSK